MKNLFDRIISRQTWSKKEPVNLRTMSVETLAQKTQSRIKNKNSTLRHIIFKLQKTKQKEKILKAARGFTLTIEKQR